MREEKAREVRAAYEDRFLSAKDAAWHDQYVAAVRAAREISESEFRSPDFQRHLWESDDVSSIGPGSSVIVTGAYTDADIVTSLWELRGLDAGEEMLDRARTLSARFEHILGLVSPRHNQRRPSARLARIFATLRPNDALCLVDGDRTRQVRQWLEQSSYKLGFVGQHVIIRSALAGALGAPASLEEAVLHSQFVWFVWDQILSPADPDTPAELIADSGRATDKPRLSILPAKAQRRGFNYHANNLDLLLSVVRAAEYGIDKEAMDQQIAEDAPTLKRNSRGSLVNQARTLGLLSLENGALKPTTAGRALLEGEPPDDVIVPAMIRHVFGFAQILDDLARQKTMTKAEIGEACRSYYPRWTTDYTQDQLVFWIARLGLADMEGGGRNSKVTITERGEYWRSGLPENLKRPELLLRDELQGDPAIETAPEEEQAPIARIFEEPALRELISRFRDSDELKGLVFSDEQIGLLHAALHAVAGKRFVLLAGLSGTGKTSIARAYATAYCEVLGLDPQMHFKLVAVWPDWTDPTGLLGFVNPLANPPIFQETPALRFLLAASQDPGRPYFLCLDEMNLARVEHYFAPFLSAMEGSKGELAIHASGEAVDQIRPSIPWPRNLFIMGTVNMDETTHPFSDKVLDRAFTFEFWDVDLAGWRDKAAARGLGASALDEAFPLLEAMAAALKPARRHFGYRTCDEIVGFVQAAGGDGAAVALDAAVLAKILPKVRGDDGGPLPKAIAEAIDVCARFGLAQSGAKLVQMQASLAELGAVRFWS